MTLRPSTRQLHRTRRTLTMGALAATVALTATGCAGGDDNVVRVYSARHYQLEQAFEKFNEETGIKVEFLFGSDAELREKIEAEGEDTQADRSEERRVGKECLL